MKQEGKQKKEMSGFKKVMIITLPIALLFFVLVFSGGGGSETAYSNPDVKTKSSAVVMAEEFVKGKLKAPGTADFNSYNPELVEKLDTNHFKVKGWVDAENSFGAKIRNNYTATVRYDPDEEMWYLENLNMN